MPNNRIMMGKIRCLLLAIAFIAVPVSSLLAETSVGVLDLNVELKNGATVVLSWRESPGLTGSLAVYRSSREFVDRLPASASLVAIVPVSVGTCIDIPEGPGPWYYIVLPESRVQGARNSLPAGSRITQTAIHLPSRIQETPTPTDLERRLSFKGIYAVIEGDAVNIHFTPLVESGRAVLYRSTKPVRSMDDLVNAVILQVGAPESPYIDYPVPGIECWYTIILEDDFRRGLAGIFPGENATEFPVEVSVGTRRTALSLGPGKLRSMPLPLISRDALAEMIHAWPGQSPLPRSLHPEASRAVADILSRWRSPQRSLRRSPQVFQIDLSPSSGGEAFVLYSIINERFRIGRWEESADALGAFLSLPRSEEAENRARFYLAQTYYFRSDFRLALFEFLLSHRSYPVESNAWIQDCLRRLSQER